MTWRMSERIPIITPTSRCWATGPSAITSRYVLLLFAFEKLLLFLTYLTHTQLTMTHANEEMFLYSCINVNRKRPLIWDGSY